MNRSRIGFFFQYPYVEIIPLIKEPIIQLAADGFGVDLFAPVSKQFPEPNFAPYDVCVRNFDFRSREAALSIPRIALSRRYALLMANPVEPLIYGAFAAQVSRIPLIAVSDEL